MGTKKSNKLYAAAAALAVTASAVAPGLTADAASKVTVKSVTNPASISHYGGYTFAVKKLSLPKTVKVLLSNKKYENRSVKWGKVSYDKKYIGKYQTISGTVSGTTKKASIKVKLNNYPVDVIEPKLAPVAVGEKLNLPSTIDVKYKDGKVIARSAKSFNLTAEKTDKAGMMKLSYNYMGKNSSIKGSIAYEVKAAEITNVMDEVKEDTLSVSADVKFPAKDAKAQLLIFPGKDESKALPAIDGKLEGGKFTAEGKMIPDGTHSYSIKIGDVVTPAKEFKVDNAAKIEGLSAVSTKSLKVQFNKAVDTTKAIFEVKKGTPTANISKYTWSEDKKSVTLELAGKLSAGEYTVNVKGLTETTLTKSVNVENEKVAKIEVASDKAILTSATSAVVGYKVLNQYGEDITKTVTVNVTPTRGTVAAGDVDASKGMITVNNLANVKSGEKFTLTLVHGETAVNTTKEVTVSDASKVDEVKVTGLYNADGKALTEDNRTSTFYVKLDAKDQYGNSLKAADLTGNVIVNSSNQTVVGASASDIKDITIDGVKTTVVELNSSAATAGKSTITVISLATGKSNTLEVEVKEGVKVNTFGLSQPELAVAKEKIEIPFEALDKDGNKVDKKSLLNAVQFNVAGLGLSSSDISIVTDSKGVNKLVLDATNVSSAGGPVTITTVSPTQKVSTLVVNVKEAAKPVYVSGLKDIEANLKAGGTVAITVDNLVIKDQYDRDYDISGDLGTSANNFELKVTSNDTAIASISNGGIINAAGGSLTLSGIAKGTASLKVELLKYPATGSSVLVNGSEFEKTIRVAEASEFVSYEVANISTVFDDSAALVADNAYEKALKVYGVLANGQKVLLDDTDYSVRLAGQNGVSAVAGTTDKEWTIDVTAAAASTSPIVYAENATEATAKAIVTINSTGDRLEKEFTISKVAPKVSSTKFNDTDVVDGIYTVSGNTATTANLFGLFTGSNAEVKDQYGELAAVSSAGVVRFANGSTKQAFITVSNIVDASTATPLTVANNGTATATVSSIEAGDSFKSTFEFVGGYTSSVKVVK